ncbi:PA domain [Branchiostoma belcheri]|nr:PA domain [Branchiostoma belcheri]
MVEFTIKMAAMSRGICAFLAVVLLLVCLYEPLTVLAHSINEQLYFEILYPQDINYLFKIRPAKDFGAPFDFHYDHIHLVPTDPAQSCSSLNNGQSLQGAIAMVERGGCSFMSKALMVEQYGAVAVVIYDSNQQDNEHWVDMIQDETERDTSIAAAFLLGKDGSMIKKSLQAHHLPAATISIPVNITSVPLNGFKQPPWSFW